MKIFKKIFYLTKFYVMYFYKMREKNPAIDNYADILVLNPLEKPIEIPKKIWIYWEGDFPVFVEKCIENIKRINSNYEVNILNPQNVNQYSDINFAALKSATPQQKADLLRFNLIYLHGGIWLDASIIVYENLDWIQTLLSEKKTDSFAFYRKKNTTNTQYPVLENWLLASVANNPFFKAWFEELYRAIEQGPKKYINTIKQTDVNHADIFQQIGRLEYLVAYVACQKVMRTSFLSITLINCDENAFFYQVNNSWVKEKTLINMAVNYPPDVYPKLIKLAGKERNHLKIYYEKGMYFKGSLLDI
ncbi:glycosyltransferase family 32 protein [Acinetobacter silvestris]|uniref:Uncharacterized protein n=1 Tax=Acinetobacter silvestris TaxID=1977882 RepID=A0A1Y3CN95_9GAMM|nr:capsular polysaccharide synthesis protein [Acinetobacter silvestris]OTG67353.1 hypothetical protein B9T28_01605 [Acinetobacter silvestris]